MQKFYKLILLLTALIFTQSTLCAQSESAVIDKIIKIGTSDNRTMNHLDVLSNRIGGRLLGSDAYANATTWVANTLKSYGLEVQVIEVGEMPVGFNRGPWFGRMLSEDGMTLHFATPSYTSGTKGVQRGHVVMEPKTRAQFDRVKGKLNGAWVLITGKSGGSAIDYSPRADSMRAGIIRQNISIGRYNDSLMRAFRANPNMPKPEFKETKDSPALFYKEMRDAGILGIIQSTSIPITAVHDRNLWNMTFDNLPTCPDIKLNENQYKIIAQKVKERQYFQLEFDIRNHFKPGPVKYHNVVGIIKGTEFPDEYVMSGGHLDAFDVATGGVDCGTGVAPNLEAARLIMEAGGKTKRSILFCFWAGEEFGLLGSRHWVKTNEKNLDKISNYFNRDYGPTVANSLTVPPAMYEDFKEATKDLNRINPDFPFYLYKRKGEPGPVPRGGSSDHAHFAMNGVPTVSFDIQDTKGYDFNYNDVWHTDRDTYDMSIPEYMDHTSVVTAIVLYNLANQDSLLSREGLYIKPDPKNSERTNRNRR